MSQTSLFPGARKRTAKKARCIGCANVEAANIIAPNANRYSGLPSQWALMLLTRAKNDHAHLTADPISERNLPNVNSDRCTQMNRPLRDQQSCKVLLTIPTADDYSMNHSGSANSLKHRALEVFAKYGPLNPAAWAVLAPMYPIRSAYTYLLRLHRFGLLNRERDQKGLLLYTISERGRERLNWLSIPNGPQ